MHTKNRRPLASNT